VVLLVTRNPIFIAVLRIESTTLKRRSNGAAHECVDVWEAVPFRVDHGDADGLADADALVGVLGRRGCDPDGECGGFADAVVVGDGTELCEGCGDVVVEGFAGADVEPVMA
jgi:hypothetical protein